MWCPYKDSEVWVGICPRKGDVYLWVHCIIRALLQFSWWEQQLSHPSWGHSRLLQHEARYVQPPALGPFAQSSMMECPICSHSSLEGWHKVETCALVVCILHAQDFLRGKVQVREWYDPMRFTAHWSQQQVLTLLKPVAGPLCCPGQRAKFPESSL